MSNALLVNEPGSRGSELTEGLFTSGSPREIPLWEEVGMPIKKYNPDQAIAALGMDSHTTKQPLSIRGSVQ